MTHIFFAFFNRPREAVNDASLAAHRPATVLAEPLLAEDLNQVLMRGARMEEQRQMVLPSEAQLCTCGRRRRRRERE